MAVLCEVHPGTVYSVFFLLFFFQKGEPDAIFSSFPFTSLFFILLCDATFKQEKPKMSCAFLKGTLCHRAGSGYPCVERKSPVLPLRYIIRCEQEG